jgi:hypothetical protein
VSASDYYFGRDGQPISQEDWIAQMEDVKGRRVAEDTVGDFWISTVWLGLDYGFGRGDRPIIFETMVFDNSEEGLGESQKVLDKVNLSHRARLGPEAFCNRYCTEAEALKGHRQAVAAAEAGLIRREDYEEAESE